MRLQRDNSSVVVYLGRCPRLYTFALSARVGHTGAHGASWALPLAISQGRGGRVCSARWTHGGARGIMGIASCHLPWPWRACLQRALDTRERTGHHGHCSLPSPMAMEGVFAAHVGHTGAHGASWALSLVVSYGLRGRFFGACCSHEGTYGNHWKYGSRHLGAGNYHQRTGSAFYLLTLLLFTFQNCLFAFLPCSPSKSRAFLRFCGLFSVLLQWCRGTQRT